MRKATELDGSNSEYWFMLGDLLSRNEELEAAMDAYEKVTGLDPGNQEIWLDYSDLMASNGKMDEAVGLIRKGIDKLPHDPDLQYRLAAYLLLSGRAQEAYEVFGKAMEMNFMRHHEVFIYRPELRNNAPLIELIDLHRKRTRTTPDPGEKN
ncbi:MAG TPA: tetratricopeptide repeat protein, partial [Bacteroidales bacterium]|nr:tetratricopeptide repeat protein [Bacteroidales bacterium]